MNCQACLHPLRQVEETRGMHVRCLRSLFGTASVDTRLEFARSDIKGQMLSMNTQRMSISGVQQKLSLRLLAGVLQPVNTNGEYILKPSPDEYPQAAGNEHVSMLLGRLFRIETAKCCLIRFSDGEYAYLTKRYDRDDTGRRLHQEDMAQALGRFRDDAGEYKYTGSYEEVGQLIRRATGGKLAAVYDYFRRLLVRFVIKDGDYHLKNISLWKPDKTGAYAGLTPNYDMLNTGIYLPHETTFALNFLANDTFTPAYEKLGYYTWADFAELARRINLTSRAADRARSDILERVDQAQALLLRSFLSDEMKKEYATTLEDRIRCLTI